MREIRYITDDRDKEDRKELVLQHGANGDLYVSVVDEGLPAFEGVRLATSGGAGYKVPDLVFGLMSSFNQIYEKATSDPTWAETSGISVKNWG
ncbi:MULTISPECIES: hypothetical protein [Herbaspirillum]|uniref:Uncharacterized protein n=2 Tax=Herbaspirillum huttiense TaxID=863372 RepID=A0AAJ2H536_9BURK|nr:MULTISPECIES: hypothetical protein [Herbaspirillum]MDR9836902.1 hypothetical protein [Herbaspirillum huttiense]